MNRLNILRVKSNSFFNVLFYLMLMRSSEDKAGRRRMHERKRDISSAKTDFKCI
jgi:hypothetical protein